MQPECLLQCSHYQTDSTYSSQACLSLFLHKFKYYILIYVIVYQMVPFLQVTEILHSFFTSTMGVTCSIYLVPYHLTFLIIFCSYYKSRSSPLCSYVSPPVTPLPVCPNTLLNSLYWNTCGHVPFPRCEKPSFTPTQNQKQSYFISDFYCFHVTNERTKNYGPNSSRILRI